MLRLKLHHCPPSRTLSHPDHRGLRADIKNAAIRKTPMQGAWDVISLHSLLLVLEEFSLTTAMMKFMKTMFPITKMRNQRRKTRMADNIFALKISDIYELVLKYLNL